MLSKAQHNCFSSTKEPLLIWPRCRMTGEELCLRYKEGGCAERLRIALDIYTARTFLIKARTAWFNSSAAVAKQSHITVGRPACCSGAITKAAIISTRIQVKTQVLTWSFYNGEGSFFFFFFPRAAAAMARPRRTSASTCCHFPLGARQIRPIWPLRVPALGGVSRSSECKADAEFRSGTAKQRVQKQRVCHLPPPKWKKKEKKSSLCEIMTQLPLAAIKFLQGSCVMENFHAVMKIC